MNLIAVFCLIFMQIVLACPLNVENTKPSKIIFLLPISSKSHKNVFDPLTDALLERGHHITVVSPVKSPKPHPNLREIHPVPLDEILKSPVLSGGNMFEKRKQGKGKLATLLTLDTSFMDEVCHRFYQNEEIQEMIKSREKFDLAFVNAVPNQCVLGFVHVLKIPHIYLATLPVTNAHLSGVGGYFPRSFVPCPFGTYLETMTFTERVMNFIVDIVSGGVYYRAQSTDIYRKYLGPEVPSVEDIDKNVSMIFMNTNLLLTFARPLMPQVVEVGGLHCRDGSISKIPSDLQKILGDAEHGFIYFSLGSIVKTKNMPAEVRSKFLRVFSKLKETVIWKWDYENETDLPKNVIVRKWLPQQDILAHPNIKLFITHGGLLSTQEALFHGVPLLGSPMYVDQRRSHIGPVPMKQAENLGWGLTLEIADFTEKSLDDKIDRLLHDPSFSQNAKRYSKIFRDQPHSAIEKAVYWTEYVIRHGGAYHLQSHSARFLNIFQFHSIDVIMFLGTISLVVIMVFCLLLYKITKITLNCLSPEKAAKNRKKSKLN